MKVKILLGLVLVVLLSVSATADFLDIDQSHSTTIYGGPVGERQAQTFTTGPTTQFVTAFAFKTWNPGGTADVVNFDLREYEVPANWEGGTLLGSKVETFVGASDSDWLKVTFDTPIPVTPSTLYNMFITNMAGYAGYYVAFDDPYAGGLNSRWTPNWSLYYTRDLAFRVWGDVPEPATIALLGLGALALLRKRS